MESIRIRPLKKHSDYDACVKIQKEVWRHKDLQPTPAHQFCISDQTGAILLGAFSGHVMTGFVYSFPALFGKRLCQHSHLLAVLPECQGLGIGKKLKWAQREECLRRGYNLVTWTFDPLLAKNANLNLHTLGAVVRTYLPNFYGPAPSLMLGPDVPTDRLYAEWWIRSERVKKRKWRAPARLESAKIPEAVFEKGDETLPPAAPGRPDRTLAESLFLVEVPGNILDFRRLPKLIAAWQKAIRKSLQHHLAEGCRVDDFMFGDRSFYVLKRERIAR